MCVCEKERTVYSDRSIFILMTPSAMGVGWDVAVPDVPVP